MDLLNENINENINEDEYYSEDEYDKGDEYHMIKNIAFLFYYMGDFVCNKQENLFDLWPKKETVIKKRIEVINKCLDVYDILFPFNRLKPILGDEYLRGIHKLMDRLFYDTAYTVMDEVGVDLNLELGSPGWLDLKKVILRFFSKIKTSRKYKIFEEEVEGTGHIRPIRRGKLKYNLNK